MHIIWVESSLLFLNRKEVLCVYMHQYITPIKYNDSTKGRHKARFPSLCRRKFSLAQILRIWNTFIAKKWIDILWRRTTHINTLKTAIYGMPPVKVFYGQKWILCVICRYSFKLHLKMFAPCPNLSTIWTISPIMCLISLLLYANWCVTIYS